MSTSATPAPSADSSITAERGSATLREILKDNLDDDTLADTKALGIDLETTAGDTEEIVTEDRAQLLAFADRLLARLAADDAGVDEITAAAKKEVQLISERYAHAAKPIQRAATWKRQALEQLARILFPSADAKRKSINLPFGTLGRKDYAPTPQLMDESKAIQLARRTDKTKVSLAIHLTLAELEARLLAFAHVLDQEPMTLNEAAATFAAQLIDLDGSEGKVKVTMDLAWGAVKKEPAVALYAVKSVEHPEGHGVVMAPARTVFYSELTEAK